MQNRTSEGNWDVGEDRTGAVRMGGSERGLGMLYKCRKQQSWRPNTSELLLLVLSRSPVGTLVIRTPH